MKRSLMVGVFLTLILNANAQRSAFEPYVSNLATTEAPPLDSPLFTPRVAPWCVDLGINIGMLAQYATSSYLLSSYPSALNYSYASPFFRTGYALGGTVQLGRFFGARRHWGVGTGLSFQYQRAKLEMANFHTEFEARDSMSQVYRQMITNNGTILERVSTANFNIPLVLKYQTQFLDRWGFSADAGFLFNIGFRNSFKSNASFNYEAAYQFSQEYMTYVYDNSPVVSKNDLLLTTANAHGNVAQTFAAWRAEGYNVALDQSPASTTGKVKFNTGSVGLILQPAMTYAITTHASLIFGVYIIYQDVSNNGQTNYAMVNSQVGQYSSLLNNVTDNSLWNMGVHAGVRISFGKDRDRDHDGVPDRIDRCPRIPGPAKYAGCPDSDADGIPDIDDSCPHEFGLPVYNGCPDFDADGIPDREDSCPQRYGLAKYHGCPDTDGDGIPDNLDSCPRQFGLAKFDGCPDSDGDGIPDNLDMCPFTPGTAENRGCPDETSLQKALLSRANKGMGHRKRSRAGELNELDRKQIHFDFNRASIKKSSYRYLDGIVKEMKSHPETFLTIDGYCDNIGSAQSNVTMSKERAESVRNYMIKHGIDGDRLIARGHGKREPIANNQSTKGRAVNRRALMVVKSNNKTRTKSRARKPVNNSAINVKPNDDPGSFTITLTTNFEENAVVTITNEKGVVVKTFNIVANQPTEFMLDEPSGLYNFTAETPSTRYEARIVITQ